MRGNTMKKKTKLLILFILCVVFLCALAALSACKKEEGEKTPETDATFIEITPLKVVLDLYEQETLTATVRKGAEYLFEEVSWSSADPSVAAVSAEGVVSAVSEGETKVIAKYQTYEASCDVVVSLSGAKANLALADYEIGMRVDETKRISPVVRYKGKSYNDADFTYTVEDKTIAAVSSSGVIEALKYGVTKVTVSASWRGVTGEDAELLTKELTIDVKDNIYATIEDNSYVVYQADTEIDKILQLRGELPLEVEGLENEIADLKAKSARINEQIDDAGKRITEYKHNIVECDAQLEKYRAQVDNVANSREYDSLNKEIENQGLLREIAEKNIYETKEFVASKKQELEGLKEQMSVKNDDLKAKKQELATIVESTSKEEERLRAARQVCADKIDARTMSAYERIRSSCNNHLAVVSVFNGNACGGCFNTIPPQRLIDIASNKKMIICEYCGRILVNPDFD